MQRALHEIDQLLHALQEPAKAHRCLPYDDSLPLPFDRPDAGQSPAPSAVYFCLTSASALLEVSRSLLGHLGALPGDHRPASWIALSEASKAAGQSAFLASVMLNAPTARDLDSTLQQSAWAGTQVYTPVTARPRRNPIGVRVKTKLRSFFGAIAA
ncbi:hypothetical protein [Variovorax sp. KK3]